MIRASLPNRRRHDVIEFMHGNASRPYVAGIGYGARGSVAEVFLNFGRSGAEAETNARDAAIILSLALQHDVPLDTIRHALTRNDDGTAQGPIGALLDLLAEGEGQ